MHRVYLISIHICMENDLNIHFVVCPNKEIKPKYNTYRICL